MGDVAATLYPLDALLLLPLWAWLNTYARRLKAGRHTRNNGR